MSTLAFFVAGVPATAGSKRAFVYTPKGGGKPRAVVVDDAQKAGKPWRVSVQAAALEARAGPMLPGALELEVLFVMPRPRGHFHEDGRLRRSKADLVPTVRPDATKLLRALEDALTGIVYRDDSQVVTLLVKKRYEGVALPVGARVVVRQVHVYDDTLSVGVVNVQDVGDDLTPLGASATLPGLR